MKALRELCQKTTLLKWGTFVDADKCPVAHYVPGQLAMLVSCLRRVPKRPSVGSPCWLTARFQLISHQARKASHQHEPPSWLSEMQKALSLFHQCGLYDGELLQAPRHQHRRIRPPCHAASNPCGVCFHRKSESYCNIG